MYFRRFISVMAAAMSIGVCAFITFISRDTDFNTIIYNLAFLAVMLVMLLFSWLFGVRKLIGACRGLKNAITAIQNGSYTSTENPAELFHNAFLDDTYQQYCHMLRNNPDAPVDIQNYINEEAIETYVHRGILEMIPDILTSLGILGTFLGLVMGLRSFDPSSYEQMTGSITPLINGIKIAFITSIYGISLSMAFSFHLRSEFSHLSELSEEFLDMFYLKIHPPYEVDSLSRLLDGQKSREDMTKELTTIFVEQMGQSFENVITPAYERMTEGIHQIVDSFTVSQTQVISQVCESVISQMRNEMREDFDQLSQTIQELQRAQSSYTDYMDRSMSHLQQTFVALQDNISQMSQYNTQALSGLNDAHKDSMRINREQQATYQEYIRFMYQSIDQFSKVWEKYAEQLQRYSDEISKMGPVQSNLEIRSDLDRISSTLQELRRKQLHTEQAILENSGTEIVELLDETLRRLNKLEDIASTPTLFRSRHKK